MEELTVTTTETDAGIGTIDIGERCGRFFQYSAAHAWDALARMCAPGACFARNGAETDLAGMLAGAQALTNSGIEYSYGDIRRMVGFEDRTVVEQHRTTLHRGDGVDATADVCVVVRFDEQGLITRLDEYVDTASFTPLFH